MGFIICRRSRLQYKQFTSVRCKAFPNCPGHLSVQDAVGLFRALLRGITGNLTRGWLDCPRELVSNS